MPLFRREDSPLVNLFIATKSRWKRMRVIMNPTFSTAKLREVRFEINVFFLMINIIL